MNLREMEHKLLFKCNIVGNSVMKKNRITKSNNARNTKRKELFSQNRDICDDEPAEPAPISKTSKKAEEYAQKRETYKARFAAYMDAKKQRLAQERLTKKLPFINATGGHSQHVASFQFTAPKPPALIKDKTSKTTTNATITRKEPQHSTRKPKNATTTNATASTSTISTRTRSAVARQQKEESAKLKKTTTITRPPNLKITKTSSKNAKNNLLLIEPSPFPGDTPLMKDKVFTFNGIAVTSTARKDSTEKNIVECDGESTLSPIDGIAPLEATVCNENAAEIPTSKKPITPAKDDSFTLKKCFTPAIKYETPPKEEGANEGTFYLSPFVTTSRGKCSAKKERQSRNSVYKLELNQSVEEPLDIRRRREAVKYFRKVLDDEISRLNSQCTTWELYKETNEHAYEDCVDMINVSIGQTKLLISGKFKQMEQLIDKCEKVANENLGYRELINSEDDVTAEDLEGFWNIVKLQVDNVDLRFEKLTAWRNNDWKDPEEKPKPKKKVLAKSMKVKPVKQKVKPTDGVRNLLLKARQEFLQNKAKNGTSSEDVIFVTKRKSISTPVKENRSSLTKRNQTPYRTSSGAKENRVPNVITPAHRRLSILKNVGGGSGNRYKSRLSETPKSSTSSARKSILKSVPKSTQKKSVLFSEQIDFKSPDRSRPSLNSLGATSGAEDPNESDDAGLRVRNLRARAIVFRGDVFNY